MWTFILGLFLGTIVGAFAAGLCVAARRANREGEVQSGSVDPGRLTEPGYAEADIQKHRAAS